MRAARVGGLLLLLACLAPARPARADTAPGPSEWPVERNAQVLKHREWKLGLWGFDGGILDRVQVGTLWWTWPVLSPNVHVKARLVQRGPYTLTLESSFIRIDLDRAAQLVSVDDVAGKLHVLPVEAHFDAWAHPRLLVGGGASYSFVQTSPEYDPQNFEGSGGYDSLFLHAHLTARATKRLWVVTEVEWLLYQGGGAVGSVEAQVDPFIYASGEASAVIAPLDPGRGGAITASLLVRHRRFGMRFGVGYGTWVTPRLRVVMPRALPYGTLDFFARWGGQRQHAP